MNFRLDRSIAILERAPETYKALLYNLPEDWIYVDEGKDSWNPHEIMGHLILGEQTDWIPRTRIMLSDLEDRAFTPFDMQGHLEICKGKTMEQLVDEFTRLRSKNLKELISWNLSEADLSRTGIHPEFGTITVRQHLATWVIHDLSHLNQITRVMAKYYRDDVGPWTKYFRLLKHG